MAMRMTVAKPLGDCKVLTFYFSVPIVFYTYARLVLDHGKERHLALREKEANFCLELWRAKRTVIAAIGRDLVRALYDAKEVGIPS